MTEWRRIEIRFNNEVFSADLSSTEEISEWVTRTLIALIDEYGMEMPTQIDIRRVR